MANAQAAGINLFDFVDDVAAVYFRMINIKKVVIDLNFELMKQSSNNFTPKRKCDYIGLTVKSIRPMRNGHTHFAEGTVFLIQGNSRVGFSMQSKPCESCGTSAYIRAVQPDRFVVLQNESNAERIRLNGMATAKAVKRHAYLFNTWDNYKSHLKDCNF